MVKSASVIVLIFVLCGLPASGQTSTGNAATKGMCSPATSGSNNNFVIQCGIGQEQGKKIIDMLNAALASRDDATINAKLDELLATANKPLQPIVLSATIRNPTDLAISVENKSDRNAKDILWQTILYRESDAAMFSFASQSIGYVKGLSTGSPYAMRLQTLSKIVDGDGQIRQGDVFTGSILVDCADCAGVTYIVHIVWGQSGWQYEVKNPPGARLFVTPGTPSPDAKKQLIQQLNDFAPISERVPIL
jgi:hypothetical protein